MTIIKRNITSETLANKAKEFALRRINNRADKAVRMRLMGTVVDTLCTDNVHLVIDGLNLHLLVWIPLRNGLQEDLSLLLNITSDLLAWASGHGIARKDLIQLLADAYGSIGPSVEYDPNLDEANRFVDQSTTIDTMKELLEDNIWYAAVILLSASDIRAELISAMQAIEQDTKNGS